MDAVRAILRALARALRRGLGTFGSLKVNNFFLFILLMIAGALNSGVAPVAAEPFLLLTGILVLVPLSADPLERIPRTRLSLWPLSPGQRFTLRAASLAFNPIVWLAVAALAGLKRPGMALIFPLFAAGVRSLSMPRWHPLRLVPRLPGRTGRLVQNNLRQIWSVLDTYLAVVLCGAGLAYRFGGDPQARQILAILVALALSTYTQGLFSLDGPAGATRLRLLPLEGWRCLLAKDAAWLLTLLVLAAPLDAGAGMAFGFVALAAGRYPAVAVRLPVERWRFAGGRVLFGVLQGIAGTAVGMVEHRAAFGVLAGTAAIWLTSLFWGGKYLFRDTVVRQ